MNIGKLDRKVALQIKTGTKDAYGQPDENWVTQSTVWCEKIDVVRAATLLDSTAGQETTKFVSRFIIRYRTDIDGTWRLLFEGRVYEISQIAEIGRREGLEIAAIGMDSDFFQDA